MAEKDKKIEITRKDLDIIAINSSTPKKSEIPPKKPGPDDGSKLG